MSSKTSLLAITMLMLSVCLTMSGCPKAEKVADLDVHKGPTITPPVAPEVPPPPPDTPATNDYTDAKYDSVLTLLNSPGAKLGDPNNKHIKWCWADGNHDVLLCTLHDAPSTADQRSDMGDVVSKIYHMELPEKHQLKVIIKDVDMKNHLFEHTYRWASAESETST